MDEMQSAFVLEQAEITQGEIGAITLPPVDSMNSSAPVPPRGNGEGAAGVITGK